MFGIEKGVTKAPHRDITKDPREDEEWFTRLPPAVQQETREAWQAKRVQHVPWYGRRSRMRRRCLVEGVVVILVPSLLMAVSGWAPLVGALPIGLGLGWLWWLLGTGRMRSGALAMGAMLVHVITSGFWTSAYDFVAFFFSVFAIFVAGALGSGLGVRREMDRREQAL